MRIAGAAEWASASPSVLASIFCFFKAEDGIRDLTVTGVQTCALPIFGALRRDPAAPPLREKLSLVHTFTFPAQDFKLRTGSRPRRAGTREPVGELVLLDEDARRLQLKAGPRTRPLDDTLSLIPEAPFDDKVLREAIYRYGQAVIAGDQRYGAVTSVLKRELPRICGRAPGAPLLPADADTITASLAAIKDLQQSHLLVQGPPGAGKTLLSAAAIVELLPQRRRGRLGLPPPQAAKPLAHG